VFVATHPKGIKPDGYDRRHYTWAEMLEAVADPNSAAPNWGTRCSSRDGEKSNHWDLNEGYSGALELARGDKQWTHGRQVIESKARVKAAKTIAALPRTDYGYDVHGQFFDVASVIEGRPECWLVPTESNTGERKLVRLLIDLTASGGISADQLAERMLEIGAAILALDAADVATEVLLVVAPSMTNGSRFCITVQLKTAGQPLDMHKLVAAAHPALFRRLGFRLIELTTLPVKYASSYFTTYGLPKGLVPEERAEILNGTTIYLPAVMYGGPSIAELLAPLYAIIRERTA